MHPHPIPLVLSLAERARLQGVLPRVAAVHEADPDPAWAEVSGDALRAILVALDQAAPVGGNQCRVELSGQQMSALLAALLAASSHFEQLEPIARLDLGEASFDAWVDDMMDRLMDVRWRGWLPPALFEAFQHDPALPKVCKRAMRERCVDELILALEKEGPAALLALSEVALAAGFAGRCRQLARSRA